MTEKLLPKHERIERAREQREIAVRNHDPLGRHLDDGLFDADENHIEESLAFKKLNIRAIERFIERGDFTVVARDLAEADLARARKAYGELLQQKRRP